MIETEATITCVMVSRVTRDGCKMFVKYFCKTEIV